jgi:hypothetical protein
VPAWRGSSAAAPCSLPFAFNLNLTPFSSFGSARLVWVVSWPKEDQ